VDDLNLGKLRRNLRAVAILGYLLAGISLPLRFSIRFRAEMTSV
jgi:hypothetical protein